ncbi:MetQ/NlpA family ABC transporter substrate-binding protein [Lactiplantibacillus plantarum]|uniref:MetQ/NlpA family ABC transporter substrate-binding protein n=1 Tax=Lactiplantibacillus plantarum TaxID=1590 RepID=UPI000A17D50C|nr:MetQ/NlpA family ABC transporter substrate-binding protein [Lactiplantibacillus plantarum]ARK33215.1 metal ABC transporter substrate-binding protein [Lactiplantibacillus plantarum]MCS6156386.1 metal ABC transporter substrate-binding protein [Lactiplantibacillus plantarum]QAR77084.1 metal ABC transporter substrate-binding protein [Lactiplantibacillus plantarum]QAS28784.1 metal ABC transporter substrate-binding protein [Lactiplantibacillus plantarum]QBA78377.1 metal ABC transporter substrate-
MRRNTKWLLALGGIIVVLVAIVGFSHASSSQASQGKLTTVKIGVAPGPYGDMATKVIGPLLEKKGYKVVTKEFNDYVQPNKALNSGEIDANLFQHTLYLKTFAKANHLKLSAIGETPTLGMGIYSKKITALSDLKSGDTVSLPNDPSNLARALQLLAAQKLITLKKNINVATASTADIVTNPHQLKIKTLDAAQLPQSMSNVTIALIPGNYSWNAKLKPSKALALEKLKEDYKEVFVVKTSQRNSKFGKAVKAILKSAAFKQAIAKSEFKDFDKPASWQ